MKTFYDKYFFFSENCQIVAASTFYAHLLVTDAIMAPALLKTSVEQLILLHKHPVSLVRIICLDGLSGFKMDSLSKYNELHGLADPVLNSVKNIIGDEFSSEVNKHALLALTRIVPALPKTTVTSKLGDIVLKIYPFFDRTNEAAVAMACFAQMASFVQNLGQRVHGHGGGEGGLPDDVIDEKEVKGTKELYKELVNQSLVSLLLHANDDGDTKMAARDALSKLFQVYDNKHLEKVRKTFLEAKFFNYGDFLKEFCHVEDCHYITDMIPSFIKTGMTYFRYVRFGCMKI